LIIPENDGLQSQLPPLK